MKKGKRTLIIMFFTTPVFLFMFTKAMGEGVQIAIVGIYGFVIACALGKWALQAYAKSRWFREGLVENENKNSNKLVGHNK